MLCVFSENSTQKDNHMGNKFCIECDELMDDIMLELYDYIQYYEEDEPDDFLCMDCLEDLEADDDG